MEIKTTYKGITEDGINGVWCGFKPDNITIIKETHILYPEHNKQLKNKITSEILPYVILDNNNTDKYEEVELKNTDEDTTDK